jgi:glycosyltransferase involved in cell wall biosynthesis
VRILIVIHTLPHFSLGGSEMCAAGLAAQLAARFDVVVCAGRPPQASSGPRRQRGPGYTIEWLDANPSRAPTLDAAYQDCSIEAQFEGVMARVQPDVVHFHGIWGLSNNLPLIARRHQAAVVFTLHDFWLMCPRGQRLHPSDLTQCHEIDPARCAGCLQPWIAPARLPSVARLGALFQGERPPLRLVLRKAQARLLRAPEHGDPLEHVERYHAKTQQILEAVDLFVAPSRFLAREFERYGVPREKILVSDNGIDTHALAHCPHKSPGPVVRFGFLGSWMPSKGVHVLIEAFRGLTENARLIVYGAEPAGDPGVYARRILETASDRRISFQGRIDPREVATAFAGMDVLVVPSLWFENAPLTIREAFTARTPVVASRCGGMAEAVRDGVDGLLFAPGDAADLRRTLRRLIADPELIAAMSRRTLPAKSLEEQTSELERTYVSLGRAVSEPKVESHADLARHP